MKELFWASFGILVYIYFGYPVLLGILSRLLPKPVKKAECTLSVSFVVVVHNEEKVIEEKIRNIFEQDYPKEKLEIIIGSDASVDRTNEIIGRYRDKGVVIIESKEHVGKVSVLNQAVSCAHGDVIVFSDARQKFTNDAVRTLVSNFADPTVGCVSGELVFVGEDESGVAGGVGFYWKYEKWMRNLESRIHSMIGATGAIYAIRRALFVPPPADTILDDVCIPLNVIGQGFRAIFDPEALAYDKVSLRSGEEFTRKVRTLAGNFQVFRQCWRLFIPFKSPVAIQFFSHKFLRATAFIFLIVLFLSNFYLAYDPLYHWLCAAQLIFYAAAVVGMILEKIGVNNKVFAIPYVFCVLNLAALVGFVRFCTGQQKVTWKRATVK